MVILKGKKKTLVFGYGDVLSDIVGSSINFYHYAKGLDNIKPNPINDVDVSKLPHLATFRYDTVESIDTSIRMLQELKQKLLFEKLQGLLEAHHKQN